MQRLMLGLAIAALAGATAAAQVETKTETKLKVKGGKEVHLTGCVEPASGPANYMLTDVLTDSKTPDVVHNYYLVGKTGELEKHVGHVMQIDGKALDRGNGKVELETRTKIDREDAPDSKTKTKTEITGNDGAPIPFLDVTSVKMLRPACS